MGFGNEVTLGRAECHRGRTFRRVGQAVARNPENQAKLDLRTGAPTEPNVMHNTHSHKKGQFTPPVFACPSCEQILSFVTQQQIGVCCRGPSWAFPPLTLGRSLERPFLWDSEPHRSRESDRR